MRWQWASRPQVIAFLTDPPVAKSILDHLHLPAHPPVTWPVHDPPAELAFPGWRDETLPDGVPEPG